MEGSHQSRAARSTALGLLCCVDYRGHLHVWTSSCSCKHRLQLLWTTSGGEKHVDLNLDLFCYVALSTVSSG